VPPGLYGAPVLRGGRLEPSELGLALNPGDTEDTLLMRYRKGHRADVLRARREGVEPVRASSVDEIDGYYGMYRETVGRWQRTPYMMYPLAFFHALLARAASGERIRIWLSRHKGQLLAGVVVFVHERHAAYWHAASTEAGRSRHAGHLALHAAILDALKLGVRTFDFMPSAGLKDVEQFKTGFAAQPADVGVHHFPGSRAYRMIRWAKGWGVKRA
jgi:lipid II:glycine glycyltransferase (peptidoglycan interpeptide bridge formation enzyme)